MFNKIWSLIDGFFAISDSAKQMSRQKWLHNICGDEVKIPVVHGLELRLAHMKQELKQGKPSFNSEARCILGLLGYDDKIRLVRCTYQPEVDGWILKSRTSLSELEGKPNFVRPREDEDYWMDEIDFAIAIENAYIRAQRERMEEGKLK